MSIQDLLVHEFSVAVAAVAGVPVATADAQVRPAGDPKFGDYQCNVAMSLARTLKSKPRDVAQRIKDAVEPQLADIAEPLEIAGPGFINIRLKDGLLAQYLGEIPAPLSEPGAQATGSLAAGGTAQEQWHPGVAWPLTDRVGLSPVEQPQRVVVEYSQPNIAKQMHVGHLRSTIIGDVLARVLAFEGHEVVRQNHIGDWGTQMGAVILGLWYIRARVGRGASLDAVRALQERLRKLSDAPVEARREALQPICSEWSEDLQDQSLDALSGVAVTLEQLELGYVFVQTLVTVAEGTGATVTNRDRTEERLEDIPRKVTRMLQAGDVYERTEWQKARDISLAYCQGIYGPLGVLLTAEDVRGESFYSLGGNNDRRDRLQEVLQGLHEKFGATGGSPREGTGVRGEVRDHEGAVVVYLYNDKGEPLFKNPDGEELGMIVQKSDGAYLYATTDLAAIRFRLKELRFLSGGVGAQRVIYVTDARQKLHFEMFFACARAAGWITDAVRVEHVTFGSVLGGDRRPLKTREGGTVKLRELLDEAEKRALELLQQRAAAAEERRDEKDDTADRSVGEEEQREIARRVGIAAVKYADLRNDRNSDYVFDWDKMLALTGNTAPYMMYAYARIRSIYRKAAERIGSPDVYAPGVTLALGHPAERALALRLARLRETIDAVAADLTPHVLCTYLYDLAADFMRFYESCPVLAAADDASRLSRMRLCDLAARTLRLGLGLLGIEVIERM
jgi:arginyl-tRNA synthetase